MLRWITGHRVLSLLIAFAALAVVTATVIVAPQLTGAVSPIDSTRATPTPTPTPTLSVTSTPSATPSPSETAAPEAPTEAQPAAPAAPAAPPMLDPGIIAMNPGPGENCGEFPSGQTIYRSFSWSAREGNTVDIYYAYTDTDVQATGGFMVLGAVLPTTGTIQFPHHCPNGEGIMQLVTLKLVASNALGSATAYYWGI